jgi:hypothetical protein
MAKARIKFSNDLLDDTQSATLKIVEIDGNLQLILSIGLIASMVEIGDNPTPEVKKNFRDAVIKSNLFIDGQATIKLKTRGTTTKTSDFVIEFKGQADTKVPGTGG